MKILYILNIAKKVNNFSYSSMIAAKEVNCEFHIAGNWSYKSEKERMLDEVKYGIHIHQVDFHRKPYHIKNIKAYNQIISICKRENIDIIHCNTPVGGLVGRIVGHRCNVNKVIYQAHGFHFYKGASLINWIIYFPVEKWLARKTDVLITINHEDFEFAKKHMKLRSNGYIKYVHGVGIDLELKNVLKPTIDKNVLNFSSDDFLIISMGDLVKRKNYSVVIKALKLLPNNVHYLICGSGPKEKKLKTLCKKLKISNRVHFLGYRSDVDELLKICNVFVLASLQEGLPRSLMEGMRAGIPCIASNIRGNIDLMGDNSNFLFNPDDYHYIADIINNLLHNKYSTEEVKYNNLNRLQNYRMENVISEIKEIYLEIIQNIQGRNL